MVALDFQASDFAAPSLSDRFAPLLRALAVLLAASIVVLAGLSVRDASGWSAAADGIWRFSAFALAVALIWEPVATLLPRSIRDGVDREKSAIVSFFALAYAAYLAFSFAPFWLDKTEPVIAMRVFGVLAAAATLALLASAILRWPGVAGEALRRVTQTSAFGFFWVSFVLCGVDHLYGPHRADRFFGISVLVLIAALLTRFAAALVTTLKPAFAQTAQRRGVETIATA